MKRKINMMFFVLNVIFFMAVAFFSWKDKIMIKTHKLQAPLLLSVKGATERFSLLPRDTILYFDKKFPNGVSRYFVHINIDRDPLTLDKEDHELPIDALDASKPSQFDLIKLTTDHQLTREDLSEILKSKYLSKSEIQELLEEFSKE